MSERTWTFIVRLGLSDTATEAAWQTFIGNVVDDGFVHDAIVDALHGAPRRTGVLPGEGWEGLVSVGVTFVKDGDKAVIV